MLKYIILKLSEGVDIVLLLLDVFLIKMVVF